MLFTANFIPLFIKFKIPETLLFNVFFILFRRLLRMILRFIECLFLRGCLCVRLLVICIYHNIIFIEKTPNIELPNRYKLAQGKVPA